MAAWLIRNEELKEVCDLRDLRPQDHWGQVIPIASPRPQRANTVITGAASAAAMLTAWRKANGDLPWKNVQITGMRIL